jgi:hypothetical protein
VGFLKGSAPKAKAAEPVNKNGCYTVLGEIHVAPEEEDIYAEAGSSLRKDIHDFLVNSRQKEHSVKILANKNRLKNIKNRKMDEENKWWSAFKKAPGTHEVVLGTGSSKIHSIAGRVSCVRVTGCSPVRPTNPRVFTSTP